MTYFRSLFFNFLAVFLITRITPGVEIGFYQQAPNLGAALVFALIVGFLNASVFACLFIFSLSPSRLKIAVITGLISFGAFLVIAVFPFGVRALSPLGVMLGGSFTWAVAYLTNYFEWHRGAQGPK